MLRIAIIFVALVFGGLAAWIVVSQRASPDVVTSELVAAPVPTTEVLVAATDVIPGAVLIPENLSWQPWPSNAVGPSFVTRSARPDAKSEMAGMIARSGFLTGEPVHESRLLGGGAGFMSVKLASGMRAVAVTVNAQSSAGGFILPNDHVDVMHTFNVSDGIRAGQIRSEIIMRNVRVLAIDQMVSPQNDDSLVGKTATLELFADQVEAISSAAVMGSIALILRPLADNDDPTQTVEIDAIPDPLTRTIRIFRTNSVEILEVEADAPAASR